MLCVTLAVKCFMTVLDYVTHAGGQDCDNQEASGENEQVVL